MRARIRDQAHKPVDRARLRSGEMLSGIFGTKVRRVLDGLAAGLPAAAFPE